MSDQIISVVGGTGFLGRYVVKHLAQAGYRVRVLARDPEAAADVKTYGDVGQVSLESVDLSYPETLQDKFNGSYGVVNLVGVLYEKGRQNFTLLHAQGPEKIAQYAENSGVKRLIHISSLGIDETAAHSKYARTKLLGEKATFSAFEKATVLRPSVIFGPEDQFFNQFAQMACLSPILPLIGGGNTRFQPVYVGDVAKAVAAALKNDDTCGNIYELGGPSVYSFKEILQYILEVTNRHNTLMNVPFTLASFKAAFLEYLPCPPITRDQIKLLKHDNVASDGLPGFEALGIEPLSVESIVPDYLARFVRQNYIEVAN